MSDKRTVIQTRTAAVLAGSALIVGSTLVAAFADHDHGKGRGHQGQRPEYAGPSWGIIDRNVIGAGDSYLRSGPSSEAFGVSVEPPFGIGSLGLRTASGEDKASFGNQVDFVGDELADVDVVKYWVFTTGENSELGAANMPNVKVELDANVIAGDDYSTLVFVPEANSAANQWTEIDAGTADRWYFTGAEGPATGCSQSSYCTLDEAQEAAPDATIWTLELGKGRDDAFSGAVDGLTWDDATYDFEPFGVREVRGTSQDD